MVKVTASPMLDIETVNRCACFALIGIRDAWRCRRGRVGWDVPKDWPDWARLCRRMGLPLRPVVSCPGFHAAPCRDEAGRWSILFNACESDGMRARHVCEAVAVYLLITSGGTNPLRFIGEARRGSVLHYAKQRVQGGVFGDIIGLDMPQQAGGPNAGEKRVRDSLAVYRARDMAVIEAAPLGLGGSMVTEREVMTEDDRAADAATPTLMDMPVSEWPEKLQRVMELLSDMPADVQQDMIALWYDQAVPHHRMATRLRAMREEIEVLDKKGTP